MVIRSGIVRKEDLIPEQEWKDHIEKLKEAVPKFKSENSSINNISAKLVSAVKDRIPEERFGIFFSGGVDSTLIAYICKTFTDDFICYTAGIEGSEDLDMSIKAAKKLGLRHKHIEVSSEDTHSLFLRTAKILGPDLMNIVNLGVASVELASLELAEKDKIKYIFGGLGSEEIFAGYLRHETSSDINEECWAGLKGMWSRDFKRDFAVAKSKNSIFLTPYLDDALILEAMAVPGELKIKQGFKKHILRLSAQKLGLPEEFAFRPKKAAQYGSRFDKAIERNARKHKFRYKKEYMSFLLSQIK